MLIFDNFQSDLFIVLNGLDQGNPFSGILYLLYNLDLLKIPKTQQGETMLLFVDDTAIIIRGNKFAETHTKLQDIMQRHDGVFDWANKHNCKFGINKFQLQDLSRKSVPNPLNPRLRNPITHHALVLGNHRIPSKELAKFLGVMVDNKLNWKDQVAAALAKGHMWLMQFGRITRTVEKTAGCY